MKLITETYPNNNGTVIFGMLTINSDTIQELKGHIQQSRATDPVQVDRIAYLIEENGFDLGKIIIWDMDELSADGATRCRAMIQLIENGAIAEFYVPFLKADTNPENYNNTRGLTVDDLTKIFKRDRKHGVFTGSVTRTVSEALDASKILDCHNLGPVKAFNPHRVQLHIVKVDDHKEDFSSAFDAVIEI